MIISNAHRFVMLAPWKTASSTTHVLLAPYNESPYARWYHFSRRLKRVVSQHLTLPDFRGLPESKLGYCTASFVRNPYDRVYSAFVQVVHDADHQATVPFPSPWVREMVMAQVAELAAQLRAADFDFEKWWALVEEHQVYVAGRNTSFPLHPAHYWAGGRGQRTVDFVGKVEAYEEDLARFCAMVAIPGPTERIRVNASPGPVGEGPYRHAARMSPAARSKVESLFRDDFELFGYDFFRP